MCDVSESRQERLAEEINLRRVACEVDSGVLESLDVSQCLLGAGMALVCTKHKLVGSLLLATAWHDVCVREVGKRKFKTSTK